MSIFGKSYDDTYKGGQQCRQDVDDGHVILHTKEPEGHSQEFLEGFRNPNQRKRLPWDNKGWHPDDDCRA